jgi:hypothetical protein
MLFDYDKDGKLDLFVGSDGYYQSTGLLRSKVLYYQATPAPLAIHRLLWRATTL